MASYEVVPAIAPKALDGGSAGGDPEGSAARDGLVPKDETLVLLVVLGG